MGYAIYLKYATLIGFSLFIGFLSAIPVGAVQVEVAKKAINGHLMPAIAVALGSATSDFIYGILTLFGLGDFLLYKNSQIIIYGVGIAVLGFLLVHSIREYRCNVQKSEFPLIYKKRISFLTGFTIAVTNPGMILWWIIGFKLFIDLGLFTVITPGIKLSFIMATCTGLGGYLIFIAHVFHRMQKSFPQKYIDRMQIVLIVLLSVLLAYFAFTLVSVIFNYQGSSLSLIKC